jgi:hypothetical protein
MINDFKDFIKLGHVIHLLSVHFLTDGDDSWKSNFENILIHENQIDILIYIYIYKKFWKSI